MLRCGGHTSRMVEMKTAFALERQKNVVVGLDATFSFVTARTIAGCYPHN